MKPRAPKYPLGGRTLSCWLSLEPRWLRSTLLLALLGPLGAG